MNKIIKQISIIIFSLTLSTNCFPQVANKKADLHFFGIIIPPTLENQKNISENLFSAHLRIIPELNFYDNTKPGIESLSKDKTENNTIISYFDLIDTSSFSKDQISIGLFAKITKLDEENLECTLYTKNFSTNKTSELKENFKSYYKLLTDIKNSINTILKNTVDFEITTIQSTKKHSFPKIDEVAMTVEGVSGTWTGEKDITKIILMRSGRGFVIFSNGASMSITVNIEVNERNHKILKITQQGNFNASFYPNIPRQKALEYSQKASPIQWNFILTESGNLEGFKYSLTLDNDGNIVEQKNHVTWNKIN